MRRGAGSPSFSINSRTFTSQSPAARIQQFWLILPCSKLRSAAGSTIDGSINNQLGGSISGNTGISLNNSYISNDITNAGIIEGISVAGISLVNGSSIGGNIINASSGTISGLHAGISLGGSVLAGNISNSGLIADTPFLNNAGIALNSSTIGGSIFNDQGASITGASGINLSNSIIVNNINNSGIITGNSSCLITYHY